jgi:DNA-binding NarL/FixJ family response regulator
MRHERPPDQHVVPLPDDLRANPDVSEGRVAGAISLMVVEQHPVSLLGVRRLLRETDVEVVAETSDAVTAVALADDRHPDVILMDLDVGPAAVIRTITASAPAPSVIVLARNADDPAILPALAAGASGCLAGGPSTDEIVGAVRAAARGESVVSASVAGQMVRRVRDRLDGDVAATGLTPRELEVLRLLARGWDNARIGEALFVSRGTVKHHISSILAKLHVENRIQAAVRAVRGGLVDE